MFDTMTITKATAGLCGALLVFVLGKTAADILYGSHGHGEQSYVIDTGADESTDTEEVALSFEEVLASADAGKGSKVFKKCTACHKLEDGANSTGPYLTNIVGREKAVAVGFGYSDALSSLGGSWTAENLNAFLESPRGYAPGNSMSFTGLKKLSDRANLIAYLDTYSN